jgi:hypothetical protein
MLLFHQQQCQKYEIVLHVVANNALELVVDILNNASFW